MDAKKDKWKKNLNSLKSRLEQSYDFRTMVQEESRLIDGLVKRNEYVKFADYRRNEGRRRFDDVKDLIDNAIVEIDCCDSKNAMVIYLQALKSVVKQTRWAKVLESLSSYNPMTD